MDGRDKRRDKSRETFYILGTLVGVGSLWLELSSMYDYLPYITT